MTDRINYETRRAIVNAIINETKDHGHTTLATLKPSQAETFAYHLYDAIGATR